MTEELDLIQKLLASIVVGYLLGSIPFAHLAARRSGIDIFATGNTRAGTANVFWNISRLNGSLVFAADAIKGSLAIVFAGLLGVPDGALILAGGAAVAGHWKSIFTRFRGGDGMVTLVGVTFALVHWLGFLGVGIGFAVVLLARRSPFRSSLGIAVCYTVLLAVTQYYHAYCIQVLELTILAMLIIFHNVLVHRRNATMLSAANREQLTIGLDDPEDLGLDLDLDLDEEADPDFPDCR